MHSSTTSAQLTQRWNDFWRDSAHDVLLRLPDSPGYPLARRVLMPEEHPYRSGALSLRLHDCRLAAPDAPGCASVTRNGDSVEILLSNLLLSGRCTIEAKEDPIPQIDIAGNLLDLPEAACQPAGGPPGGLGPVKEQWLNQARAQRTALSKTANGQQLLSTYNEHNETYAEVFANNAPLQTQWQNSGATQDMAQDTSTAISSQGVINSSTKTYGPSGKTYNQNSWLQQLNVAMACSHYSTDTNDRFAKAALATFSFSQAVTANTNNSGSNTVEMTPTTVYGTVNNPKSGLPTLQMSDVQHLLKPGQPGAGGRDFSNLPQDWAFLTDADRQGLRDICNASLKRKAENESVPGTPLFEGPCRAAFNRVRLSFRLIAGQDGSPEAASVQVDLPPFGLEIDDSAWSGAAADIARSRLEGLYFIRDLFQDTLVCQLRSLVRSAAPQFVAAT